MTQLAKLSTNHIQPVERTHTADDYLQEMCKRKIPENESIIVDSAYYYNSVTWRDSAVVLYNRRATQGLRSSCDEIRETRTVVKGAAL